MSTSLSKWCSLRASSTFCIAKLIGLCSAKLWSLNRASKTGLVIKCCANISMISASDTLLFKSSRNSWANSLKAVISFVFSEFSRIAWMRSIWVLAIFATSLAQSSQWWRLPHFFTILAYKARSISPTSNTISSWTGSGVSAVPIDEPPLACALALCFFPSLKPVVVVSSSPCFGLAFLVFLTTLSATAITSMRDTSLPLNSNLLIIASKRSSCARRALSTCHTTR